MRGSERAPMFRRWAYAPPLVWAAFAWLFVICLTQVDGSTFYALVRGIGAVEYSDAIIVGSKALDVALLAVATVLVAWVPLGVGGWRWGTDPVRLFSVVATLGGLAAAVAYSSPFAFFPLGLGALLLFAVDARGLDDYFGFPVRRSVALTVLFGVTVLAVVAVLGDVRWVVGGFDGSRPFSDWTWGFSFVSLQLMAILEPVLPEITLVMLFGWVAWIIIPRMRSLSRAASGFSLSQVSASIVGPNSRVPMLLLGAAVAIAVFVGAYPYLPAVNPHSLIVGVDPRYCYSQIMNGLPGIGYACGGATTGYYYTHYGLFLLLQGLASVGGSDFFAFGVVDPLLAAFLTASTFVFVKEGTGDGLTAGVSALFASVSLQVVAGVNAGFLANWFALSFALLFFAAVIRALRTKRVRWLLLAYALSAAVLFVHVWTWALTLGVLGIFLLWELVEAAWKKELAAKKFEGMMLVSLMLAVLATDAVRAFLPFGSGLETSVEWVLPALSLSNLTQVYPNLSAIFVRYVLGGFANPVWYAFKIAGVLAFFSMRKDFERLLGSWLIPTSIAVVLFASPDPDALPVRFLYMLPAQIFGAVGFLSLFGAFVVGRGALGRRANLWFVLALVALTAVALAFALGNVGYDYRGIPGT